MRASDAHAWVEVYFPGHGWSTFDPTPGFDSTPWQYEAQNAVQGGKVFGFLAERTGEVLALAFAATGTLMRGVARLDPASILVAGLSLCGVSLLVVYARRLLALRSRETDTQRSVRVSDARLYGRYQAVEAALAGAGIPREANETPEEYARRAATGVGDPGIGRLGEIYLYARFRDAVPAELVEEFDRLEPRALTAIERLRSPQPGLRAFLETTDPPFRGASNVWHLAADKNIEAARLLYSSANCCRHGASSRDPCHQGCIPDASV